MERISLCISGEYTINGLTKLGSAFLQAVQETKRILVELHRLGSFRTFRLRETGQPRSAASVAAVDTGDFVEAANEFPRAEEIRPINIRYHILHRDMGQTFHTLFPGSDGMIRRPIYLFPMRTSLSQWDIFDMLLRDGLPQGCIFRLQLGDELGARLRILELRRNQGILRSIRDVDNGSVVVRSNFKRGMEIRGRSPADHYRNPQSGALHLADDMHHLLERRRNQTGEADEIRRFVYSRLDDTLRRHHNA